MIIKVKYQNENVPRLEKINVGDWIDLCTADDVRMIAGEYRQISLGVAMKLPDGYEAHVLPRSSTFKKFGIIMANGIGIIDNSYSGNNDIWQFPAICLKKDVFIPSGSRIAQFRTVKNMEPVTLEEVEFLSDQDRGGFGSTDA